MLVAKGKLALAINPDLWFERFCELPGVMLAEMSPSVLVASTNLPGAPPGDPADRIPGETCVHFVKLSGPVALSLQGT